MRRACILLLLAAACGDDDRPATDASVSDALGLPDVATADSGDINSDAAVRDGGAMDSGLSDTGLGDAGSSDSGASTPDAAESLANIELSFAGCAPDLSGDIIVVRNAESIALSSTAGSFGSIQLDLQDERGNITLSTQHRVDTGAVINIISDTTWTNIAMDSAGVLSGDVADPIGGTLDIAVYDESAGLLDVTFNGATLQNPSNGSICQVTGRLRTSGLSF